eukprot:scaffold3455_cov213-Prasinococcus_capsulatus_cf.AAC.15
MRIDRGSNIRAMSWAPSTEAGANQAAARHRGSGGRSWCRLVPPTTEGVYLPKIRASAPTMGSPRKAPLVDTLSHPDVRPATGGAHFPTMGGRLH